MLSLVSSGLTVCGNDDRITGLNRRVSTNDKIKVLPVLISHCVPLVLYSIDRRLYTIVQGLGLDYFKNS